MPLEDILQDVEKRKEQEIKRISEDYQSRIDSVSSQIEEEIANLESYYRKKMEDDSRALREREIKLAEMESKGISREKISQLMQSAFERADFFMRNIADTKEYPKLLLKMVSLGSSVLGEDCIIHARKEDLSFLQDLNRIRIAKEGLKVPGIIATSSDSARELDLTIGTILEDIRDMVSLELIKHLGEE